MTPVYLPPRVRAIAYIVFSILSAAATAGIPALLASGVVLPVWVKGAVAALGAIGTALGLVAASNTPRQSSLPTVTVQPADGAVEPADDSAEDDLAEPVVEPGHAA